jgi:signal transduction histidine kinase/ligand-binding sensor domain-containing protein
VTRNLFRLFASGFISFGAVLARCGDFDVNMAGLSEAMRVWHVSDRLPSDTVTAIIQTRDGFLWIGTSAGLARFDGVTFTEIKTDESSTNQLTGVTALCEDRNGFLWIGTQHQGLFELAGGKPVRYTARKGLVAGAVTSLAADNRGQVWIGGNAGLSLWTGEHFELFTKRDGLPDDSVAGVNVAHSGTVWITTRAGMCRFVDGQLAPYTFQTDSQGRSPEYLGAYEDQRGNLWAFGDTYLINLTENKRFNYFRSSEPASLRIWSLCEGREGVLWIGTSGRGLFCFEDNRFQQVIFGEQRWPHDVRAIWQDREGSLWLGTSGGGLVQLRPQSVQMLRVDQSLPENPPTALALDPAGRIYVALQRGGLYVGESGRFDRHGSAGGLVPENLFSSLCVTRDGTLWAGTVGDGLYGWRNGRAIQLTTGDGLSSDSVLAVCADARDGVWVSTSAGAVHRFAGSNMARFDAAQGLPETAVTAMIPTMGGGLWVGTTDGRIWRKEREQFSEVEAARNPKHQPVMALCAGAQERLWIGAAGGGLSCLANGTARNWTTNDGLPSEFVAGVIEDGATNLWLSTGAGVYRVDHDDVSRLFGLRLVPLACKLVSSARIVTDPMPIFGGTRAALSPDGRAWFATSKGILKVTPRQLSVVPSVVRVYVESVVANGHAPVSLLHAGPWSAAANRAALFKAPLDLRSLEIHFTALSFVAPEDIQFRHQLEGSDPGWVEDTGARFAAYGRLPPGNYRFRVAARNAGGDWQEAGETFAFYVPTPVYYQTWAICLYILVAVAVVAGIVRGVSHRRLRLRLVRLEQQQSLERERMRIARDMHDEMGSKLTKISFLSEHLQMGAETSGPLAGRIESIAQASRDLLQTMDEIVWVVNPHNDTLENLVAYLSHYAVEYLQNTSIECGLDLPQELPHYPLSSEARHNLFLAFQEALNNVLKHSGASKVAVEVALNALACEFKITDNGKGFEASALSAGATQTRGNGHGNGVRNMRQRMTAIGGECRVDSHPGEGTVITLRLSLADKMAHQG